MRAGAPALQVPLQRGGEARRCGRGRPRSKYTSSSRSSAAALRADAGGGA
jgi:hypothetical protein